MTIFNTFVWSIPACFYRNSFSIRYWEEERRNSGVPVHVNNKQNAVLFRAPVVIICNIRESFHSMNKAIASRRHRA